MGKRKCLPDGSAWLPGGDGPRVVVGNPPPPVLPSRAAPLSERVSAGAARGRETRHLLHDNPKSPRPGAGSPKKNHVGEEAAVLLSAVVLFAERNDDGSGAGVEPQINGEDSGKLSWRQIGKSEASKP